MQQAKTMAMAQGEMAQNLAWNNRVQSMQDDIDLYTYINGRNLATNERIGNETQVLTNQIWKGRVEDVQEKVNTLLELMESDPEMKKRFEELMMNKTAK